MRKNLFSILAATFFVLAVELYVLISLPTPIKASTNPPNSDGCNGLLTVTTSESTCNTNYTGTYHVQSINGQAFHIQYTTQSYYCTNPHPTEGSQPGRPVCLENGNVNSNSADIPAGGSTNISVAAPIQNECGSAQTDLSFDAFQNGQKICSYGNPNFVFGWSFCTTNMSCNQPTATPTQIPTTTPTMPVSTPTPTQIPITSTPTPKIPMTITPTPTSIPVIPTVITPTLPPTSTTQTNTACSNITQNGVNTNVNCQINQQQQNNTQGSSQTSTQNQTQSQNVTTSSIPIAAAAPTPQAATSQTLASATVAPPTQTSQLPSTGGEGNVLFGLLSLIPIGFGIRKLR